MIEDKNESKPEIDVTDLLLNLQNSMKTIIESLNLLSTKIETIEEQILKDSEPKEDYLLHTFRVIDNLVKEKNGVPVSRNEISSFMGLSESTIYFRCEKLVKIGKITKFYGRDLDFEPAKSVFYTIPKTLYDMDTLDQIENESAKKITLALIQSQPLSDKDILETKNLNKADFEKGITYLLNRGLISRNSKLDGQIFYSIT